MRCSVASNSCLLCTQMPSRTRWRSAQGLQPGFGPAGALPAPLQCVQSWPLQNRSFIIINHNDKARHRLLTIGSIWDALNLPTCRERMVGGEKGVQRSRRLQHQIFRQGNQLRGQSTRSRRSHCLLTDHGTDRRLLFQQGFADAPEDWMHAPAQDLCPFRRSLCEGD